MWVTCLGCKQEVPSALSYEVDTSDVDGVPMPEYLCEDCADNEEWAQYWPDDADGERG